MFQSAFRNLRIIGLCLIAIFLFGEIVAQKKAPAIPDVFSRMEVDDKGRLFIDLGKGPIYENITPPKYTLSQMKGNPKGTETGIDFNFDKKDLYGRMYYGFIPYGDSHHPHPVYFRSFSPIDSGESFINITGNMEGVYDMVGWKESGKGTLGYRVVNEAGSLLYDGIVSFKGTGPFEIDVTLTEGPTVNQLTHEGAVIAFETNTSIKAQVEINGTTFKDKKSTTAHEIHISGLEAGKEYGYTVNYGGNQQTYHLRTAPTPGSRTAFTFAYASDSRAGNGGGERDVYGANLYIMKKIMALASQQDISFMQFSGDLVNGYVTDPDEMNLEYANWKRAIEPFAHYFPVYISMGNHESLARAFTPEGSRYSIMVDRFPFDTESGEAVFANQFSLPQNGPESEDGASYDPNPDKIDFPSYKENVYSYTYDNVGVIVLNSDYLYTTVPQTIPRIGGDLHGYLMDQQMAWLEETLRSFESDDNIDHVFVTQHTPCFPNGGHVKDDMWYGGNNQNRPFIAGKPLKKGIIERRNEYLDLIVNTSAKAIAILTGDEHNYALTSISPETNIHPDMFFGEKVELSRTIYQVNNGAAGAPYYAQEETPWTPAVSGFTTQNALVFFHIDGDKVEMVVVNPDTLEEVDRKQLR